jgi:hypothetical protein
VAITFEKSGYRNQKVAGTGIEGAPNAGRTRRRVAHEAAVHRASLLVSRSSSFCSEEFRPVSCAPANSAAAVMGFIRLACWGFIPANTSRPRGNRKPAHSQLGLGRRTTGGFFPLAGCARQKPAVWASHPYSLACAAAETVSFQARKSPM